MAAETKINITAVDKTQRAFSSVQSSLQKMTGALTSAKAAVGGLVASFAVKEFTGFLDTATRIENKLKLVTKSSAELAKAQAEVYRVAQTTGAGLEVTADLYSKIVSSTEALNLSSKDQIRITETVSKAISISGASAEGAAGAIIQLGQALSSGALRGEEFNSVNEQAPRIMKALADSLGVPRGKLKELASDGVLTSDIVTRALLLQSKTIDQEYAKTTTTVAESFTKLKNSAVGFFGVLDKNTGISTLFSDALSRMARGLDKVTRSMEPATVQSLTREIRDLTAKQQEELFALDKLVTENGNLNVMQQNQARIMRLNIAERGRKLKDMRAELEALTSGKEKTEELTKKENENTGAKKAVNEQTEEYKRNVQALRDDLAKLTGKTKESTKSLNPFTEETQKLYTSQLDAAFAANQNKEATFELTQEQQNLYASTLDLQFAQARQAEQARFQAEANRILADGFDSQGMVIQRALNAQNGLKLEQAAAREEVNALTLAGQELYTAELNAAFAANSHKDATFELTQEQQNLYASQMDAAFALNEKKDATFELTEAMQGLYTAELDAAFAAKERERAEKNKTKELAKQYALYQRAPVKDLDLLTKLDIKARGTATDIAGNAAFGAISGAAGASGARAMNIAQATAQGGIAGGIMALVLSNEKVQEALGKVFDALFALIDPLIDLLVPGLDALTPAIEELKPVFESLKPYFVVLGAALKALAIAQGQVFRGASELVKVVESNTKFVRDFGKELEKIGPKVEQLGKDLEKLGQDFIDGARELLEKFANGVADFIGGIVEEVGRLIEGIAAPFLEFIKPLTDGVTALAEDYISPLVDEVVALKDKFQPLIDAIEGLSKKFEKGGPLDPGGSTGGQFLQGLGSGLGNIVSGIGSTFGFKNGGMIPKARAGMLVGLSHSSGGQLINAEGGEFIFSREAVKRIGAARLNNMNNGLSDYTPAVEVNIYDGTGQRISEYDSALRVEIKERAARNNKFPAVA